MEMVGKDKVFYTDLPSEKEKESTNRITDHTKVDSKNKNSILLKSKIECLGEETFDFERSKIGKSALPPLPAAEINDESIVKLREDLLRQFKNLLDEFERTASVIRVIAVLLLFLNVLEIISIFFLLLILSLKMIPSQQILIWIGQALLLCLFQMFMLIKAITVSQSKALKQHRGFLCLSGVFIALGSCVVILVGILIGCKLSIFSENLDENIQSSIGMVQKALLGLTIFKVMFQVLFVCLEFRETRLLKKMSREESPTIDYNLNNSATHSFS